MAEPVKVVLIGCVKSKHEGVHRAEDLYDSRLFRGRLAYARAKAERWFILSACYGLLAPEREVKSYEKAMSSLSRGERRAWSERVLHDLDAAMGPLHGMEFEIHAGADYSRWRLVDGLEKRGARVNLPLEGMAFGEQLRWYKQAGY